MKGPVDASRSPLRSDVLARIVRSRLVHFVVLGGALWAIAPREPEAGVLRVSREEAQRALTTAQARTGHALGPEEQRRALADLVAERVMAAEGLRLGLAEEDEVVRSRLAAKMEATLSASGRGPAPSAEELRAEAEELAPSAAPRLEVEAAFVAKEREDAALAAEALATALARGEHPREDRCPIPTRATWTEEGLARAAGPVVARHAATAPTGAWSPPLASAWGFYVIRVLARRPAAPEELRAEATARALARRQRASVAAAVSRAAASYRLEVTTPEGAPRFETADLRLLAEPAARGKERVD